MKTFTVAQNTSFLTVASVLQKVISFLYFTFIARLIGAENTGVYFFAIAFTTVFVVVADFGLNAVITRETARTPEDTEKYVNTVFWTKVLFGVVTYLLVVFLVNILNYPADIRLLVSVSGLTMFFDNLHAVFYGVFRARKNLVYESFGIVTSQFITMIIGTIALLNHWNLVWLILAYTIPSILNVIFSSYFLKQNYNLKYQLYFNKDIFKKFIAIAFPFALAGLIGRLYSYSDSILMSKMLTRQELGLWSVPYKITFAFQFIPAALSASVYPAMSALYPLDKEKIADLFHKSWRYLFTIIFALSFGLMAVAEPVIIKLYKYQYIAAIPALRILLISLIFGFLQFITGALLNATNRQKTQTKLMATALVVNVILNIILLPRLHLIGAAIAAVVGNIILCGGGLYFGNKEINLHFGKITRLAWNSFWPAAVMALSCYLLVQKMSFYFVIPFGAIIYGCLIFVSGAVDISGLKIVYNKIIK